MPDGDFIERLPGKYQTAFRQICEDGFDAGVTASNVAEQVKKDVQGFGDLAIFSIREVAAFLQGIEHDARFGAAVPWGKVYTRVRDLVAPFHLDKLPMNLVVAACHKLVHGLEHGIWCDDLPSQAVSNYLHTVYSSRFEAHVLDEATLDRATPPSDILAARLAEVRLHAEPTLARFKGVLRDGKSVRKLRMPPRHKHAIDPNANVAL